MIPRVYGAINAVAAALSKDGIAKERLNARDDYLYRSIDDVLKRLSPLLAEHRLCILPRVLERSATDRLGEDGKILIAVTVRVAFDIVSAEDGSVHVIESCGEALDSGDKGTAKAMQSAYKYAVLQAFCVPVEQAEDADAKSHRLVPPKIQPAPDEGWDRWAGEYRNEIAQCEAAEDISRVQEANRALLASVAREQPALYRAVGEAVAKRRAEFSNPPGERLGPPAPKNRRATRKPHAPAAKSNGAVVHV